MIIYILKDQIITFVNRTFDLILPTKPCLKFWFLEKFNQSLLTGGSFTLEEIIDEFIVLLVAGMWKFITHL